MTKRKSWINELSWTAPSFLWLVLFFVIPTVIVFLISFKPTDAFGGIEDGWTATTYFQLVNPYYFVLIWRTIWLSWVTTVICLAIALPVGYRLALSSAKVRQITLLFIIVPFWSSFLIRIFAWKSFLHPEGTFKQILIWFHLISPETPLLYNSFSVLLVMVYTYLPFAIIPVYAAAAKFNFQLMEAAMDLGATRLFSFYKIFIPGIQKGLFTAFIMVFVPAIGAYVIPDLVGGTQSEMIGNKIAQRTLVDRNLPLASALSTLVGFAILLPMLAMVWMQSRGKVADLEARAKE